MPNSIACLFAPDYATARAWFREATAECGWTLESHPLDPPGPAGELLTVDVACSHSEPAEQVLVISSGLHGVEGFFGAAVQLAALRAWARQPEVRLPVPCVLIHGLNPYGFAWLRRFNEDNVDPNRNFLIDGELFQGSPARYGDLDPLLNPRRPPTRWDTFPVRAFAALLRFGMTDLKDAIVSGQYDYPQGLFYGGNKPCRTHEILRQHLGRWLGASRHVVHLDFHTGLGPWASYRLMFDYPLAPERRATLESWFGAGSYEAPGDRNVGYETRGGFGQWCLHQNPDRDYLYATAEFGTYRPLQMLTGLRAENQEYHWGPTRTPATSRVKQRLGELFCPASPEWRTSAVTHGVRLVEQAVAGMQTRTPGGRPPPRRPE